jgi:large subunit ribosomal protein L23
MDAYEIIKKPILSEKCYAGISQKRYGFVVDKRASKTEIKAAVEKLFEVSVEKVNTVNLRGKIRRRGRSEGYTSSTKKAYVQLKSTSKPIAFFEGLG